jgi:hypothetical protein
MNDLYDFDHKKYSLHFFLIALITVIAGLVLGGIIDASVRKLQKEGEWERRKWTNAFGYFLLQASINIVILMTLTKTTTYFLQWFQLSVSGALFAVLLFTAQKNLADNALRITNF